MYSVVQYSEATISQKAFIVVPLSYSVFMPKADMDKSINAVTKTMVAWIFWLERYPST